MLPKPNKELNGRGFLFNIVKTRNENTLIKNNINVSNVRILVHYVQIANKNVILDGINRKKNSSCHLASTINI